MIERMMGVIQSMDTNKGVADSVSSDVRELETNGDLLPLQYYDIVAGARRSDGARDLMLAVLGEAIRTHVTNAGMKNSRQHHLFEEVKDWFDTRGDHGPCSYETICEIFD